jgi:flagellar basal-body rod modification protein FlgD
VSTVNSIANTAAASAATSGSSAASSATSAAASGTDIGDRFLTLLVTQLKNQDPMNPMDNAQLTSQLAQISTVTGISKLNDTVSGLSAALGSNQYLQAAGLVGHSVLVPGNKLPLADGKGGGGFDLAQDADSVVVSVSDATGRVVREVELGAQTAGMQSFSWDGLTSSGAKAADGAYTFTVSASAGGNALKPDTYMLGHVDGVVVGDTGSTQVQLGRLGRVDLSQVKDIL